VIVINLGQEPIEISHGMRIAQLVIAPVIQAEFETVKTLDKTIRGTAGFGSTGQ
jgi:dUTP pyrophosphatase